MATAEADQEALSWGLIRRAGQSASTAEKTGFIEATAWGKFFSYEQVEHLASHMDLYEVKAGTVIFSEGDREAYLVLVTRGAVDIIKSDAQSYPKKMYTVTAGKTIGEMSLIDGEPRSASAIAASDARLLVMTAENFAALNETRPRIGLMLVQKIARQMSQLLRLTSGRLVDHLAAG